MSFLIQRFNQSSVFLLIEGDSQENIEETQQILLNLVQLEKLWQKSITLQENIVGIISQLFQRYSASKNGILVLPIINQFLGEKNKCFNICVSNLYNEYQLYDFESSEMLNLDLEGNVQYDIIDRKNEAREEKAENMFGFKFGENSNSTQGKNQKIIYKFSKFRIVQYFFKIAKKINFSSNIPSDLDPDEFQDYLVKQIQGCQLNFKLHKLHLQILKEMDSISSVSDLSYCKKEYLMALKRQLSQSLEVGETMKNQQKQYIQLVLKVLVDIKQITVNGLQPDKNFLRLEAFKCLVLKSGVNDQIKIQIKELNNINDYSMDLVNVEVKNTSSVKYFKYLEEKIRNKASQKNSKSNQFEFKFVIDLLIIISNEYFNTKNNKKKGMPYQKSKNNDLTNYPEELYIQNNEESQNFDIKDKMEIEDNLNIDQQIKQLKINNNYEEIKGENLISDDIIKEQKINSKVQSNQINKVKNNGIKQNNKRKDNQKLMKEAKMNLKPQIKMK
ncbi:hypothetical protein PPERSA_07669 [Pseudocohnilembus persalinus]|uniref:Uncharacterized protein n=1 Tax=Pseudocohnilembus persalinus TaxID=266149 RepID=A0A0V0QIV1_PSEPJ|nr:hypothetical protein PPERSA_07669 [Pseudocohnilembus persalinus]|eukprot:KRX02024.1 hypothetical protein PPERSA_07669 [Pseudocohnilembus persalinus]